MSAESKYNEIIEQFKIDSRIAIDNAMDEIHSNMIPYINDDTDSNAIYRAVDIVKSILSGNYKINGNNIVVNGWNIVGLSENIHDSLVMKLSENCCDLAAQCRIKALEEEIKYLNGVAFGSGR